MFGEMPDPRPAAGEVRIRIAASGINPGNIASARNHRRSDGVDLQLLTSDYIQPGWTPKVEGVAPLHHRNVRPPGALAGGLIVAPRGRKPTDPGAQHFVLGQERQPDKGGVLFGGRHSRAGQYQRSVP
jgi:hypothetical protein